MIGITDGLLEEGKRYPRFHFHKAPLSVPFKQTKSTVSLISYFYLAFQ